MYITKNIDSTEAVRAKKATPKDKNLLLGHNPQPMAALRAIHKGSGERGRARTCNRQLRRLMLYPLSYSPIVGSSLIVAGKQRHGEYG